MFASALAWVEERQGQLRQFAKLELERPARAFLILYIEETANERGLIDAALEVVRDNRPVEKWPEQLRRDPPHDAPIAWNRTWPGASREQVDDAYNKLGVEVRDRWVRNLAFAGQTYAAKHDELLTALRYVNRSHKLEEADPLKATFERVRAALQEVPDLERENQVRQFVQRLSEAERSGQYAAHELMVELRGDDSASQWLAPMVQQLESEVNTQLDTLPSRLGNWATSGLTSVNAALALGLDIILVPIYAFFLILAMPSIRKGVRNHLPEWNKAQMVRIMRDIEKVVAAFFRGRLIVCLICATLTYLGFLAVGLTGTGVPYAALFGLFIGLATAVPLAGLLFLVPAVIMAGLDGGSGLTITLIILVYIFVQVLETVVLTPTIMGHEVELHPVTLIIALLLCGKLLGILGLILAVPIAATGRILAREFFFPWLSGYVTKIRPIVRTPFDEA
jgi:predicted PurR-regulated permease PerM